MNFTLIVTLPCDCTFDAFILLLYSVLLVTGRYIFNVDIFVFVCAQSLKLLVILAKGAPNFNSNVQMKCFCQYFSFILGFNLLMLNIYLQYHIIVSYTQT